MAISKNPTVPVKTTTWLEYEELSENSASVTLKTKLDDTTYSNVHVSGPKADVKDYFNGLVSLSELRRRWG